MAKDVKIFTGTAWTSIKGPKGDDGAKGDAGVPGPTAVSADAGNVLEVGADSLLKLDPAKLDSRFVNVTGDTMTGGLAIQTDAGEAALGLTAFSDTGNSIIRFRRSKGTQAAPATLATNDYVGRLTYAASDTGGTFRTSAFSCQVVSVAATGVETRYNFIVTTATGGTATPLLVTKDGISVTGSIASTGTAHNFVDGSIPSTAMGPLPVVALSGNTAIGTQHVGRVLLTTGTANIDLTLPAAGTCRAGDVIEIVNNITTAGRYTFVRAPAGVTLLFNSPVGGTGDGTLGGGVAGVCRLRGPMTSARLLCLDGSSWAAFGDLLPGA